VRLRIWIVGPTARGVILLGLPEMERGDLARLAG
jgi:hypothetical protein